MNANKRNAQPVTLRAFPLSTGRRVAAWCSLCGRYHVHGLTPDLLAGKNSHRMAHNDCPLKQYYLKLMTRAHMQEVADFVELLSRFKKNGKKFNTDRFK